MDFFSSDAYLTALARDHYRAKRFEIKTYEIDGYWVRLAEINGKNPAVSGPFYDYVKPLPGPSPAARTVGFIPKLMTRTIALEDRDPQSAAPQTDQEPAPLILWGRFPAWEDYLYLLKQRSPTLIKKQRSRNARLARDHGELSFAYEDRNPEAFDKCLLWKMNQYQGGHETLANPGATAMLRRLFEDGNLVVSSLKIGDRYISAHACAREQKSHLSIMSSYDQSFASYGVGKELLHRVLEHSYSRGDEAFDFLQGREAYKWDYATHLQIIEAAGQPPLTYRVKAKSRQLAKESIVKLSPSLFLQLKRLALAGIRIKHGIRRN